MRHPELSFVSTISSTPVLSILRPLKVPVVLLVAVVQAKSPSCLIIKGKRSVFVALDERDVFGKMMFLVILASLTDAALENDRIRREQLHCCFAIYALKCSVKRIHYGGDRR